MSMERRVRRLEVERGVETDGHCRCAVCDDGARPSGLVFRIDGGEQAELPPRACAGCGRANAMVFNIVVAHGPVAA